MKAVRIERDSLICLQETELSNINLGKLYRALSILKSIVYVENLHGDVAGIMTCGDVQRSINEHKVSYNTIFCHIQDGEDIEAKALRLWEENHSLRAIPVLLGKELCCEIEILSEDDEVSQASVFLWGGIEKKEKLIELNKEKWIQAYGITTEQKIYDLTQTEDVKAYIVQGSNSDSELVFQELYSEYLVSYCLDFFDTHRIKFLYVNPPQQSRLLHLDKFQETILNEHLPLEELMKKEDVMRRIYGKHESRQYLTSGEFHCATFIKKRFYYCLADHKGNTYNVLAGKRYTVGVPDAFKTTIHIFGSYIARGHCTSDAYTIASYLQKLLNENDLENYRVVNYGVAGRIGNVNDFLYMASAAFQEGDIVIDIAEQHRNLYQIFEERKIPMMDCTELFNEIPIQNYWFVDNLLHLNHVGNQVIAKGLLPYCSIEKPEKVRTEGSIEACMISEEYRGTVYSVNEELQRYMEDLSQFRVDGRKEVGAIVMNCNPFTLGHRFLIEESLKRCEYLYIFVVEEDQSVFPFADRLELVRRGIRDFPNVCVLPSGKFIISAVTFPEYFTKESKQNIEINPSQDLQIFAEQIAPQLHITIRFAGEEPTDMVTRQYNQYMQTLLPGMGISFVEIPRKEINNTVISASYVRKCLKQGKVEETKNYVPESTYCYLKEHYSWIAKRLGG